MNRLLAEHYFRLVKTAGLYDPHSMMPAPKYIEDLMSGKLVVSSSLPVDKLPDFIGDMHIRSLVITCKELKDWTINYPPGLESLDLSLNGLKTVPILPEGLLSLHLEENELTNFPADLPASLETLSVADNDIREFPDMSSLYNLKYISVRWNPGEHAHLSLPLHLINTSRGVWRRPDFQGGPHA